MEAEGGEIVTLIHAGDHTIGIPTEPHQCGLCGAMSGVMINRYGETGCGRCDVERRFAETLKREARPA